MEELRAKLKCQVCGSLGTNEYPTFLMVECHHLFCTTCIDELILERNPHGDYTHVCSICSCPSNYTLLPDCIFEKQEYHHKCVDCKATDSEQNLQLCGTCYGLKFESLEDVKKNALCAGCAIKKHIRKGHQTVDFYPYFNEYNFSSELSKIAAKSDEFKSSQDLLKKAFSRFNDLTVNISKNYNELTDMARRSKSSKNQIEIFRKMETLLDEAKSFNIETGWELKKRVSMLEVKLASIKKWSEGQMENCVDESDDDVKILNLEDSDIEIDE